MTTHVVADELLLKYVRRETELRRRFLEGALDPHNVVARMQALIEGDGTDLVGRQLQQWEDLYRWTFGFKSDFSGLPIPAQVPGFDYLIVVAAELGQPWRLGAGEPRVQPQNWIYQASEIKFKCWRYATDLDTAIPTHDRHPQNGAYAVWVRASQESDQENRNRSARYFWDNKLVTQGSIEGMLHGYKYWSETGKHRDVKGWTLYPASRYSGGLVPCSYWNGNGFSVSCTGPGNSNSDGGARSAVSE